MAHEAYEEGTPILNRFLHPGFSAIEGLDYIAMAQAETIGHWVMLQNMDSPPAASSNWRNGLFPRFGSNSGRWRWRQPPSSAVPARRSIWTESSARLVHRTSKIR